MSLPPPAYNDNPKSFAFPTVRKRWPTILEGVIEDVSNHVQKHPEASKCGDFITGKVSTLLAQFKADAPVEPFSDSEIALKPELSIYNDYLARFNGQKQVTWLTGPWLYLECYLYQVLHVWLQQTEKLQQFDPFEALKNKTFQQSSAGVLELCKRLETLTEQLAQADEEALRLLFVEFADISLWGNATDLSLLAGNVTLEDIKSVQGAETRKKNEEKVLVNDIAKAWAHLRNGKDKRIDFVLDNSGFELFADLCFALFALEANIVEKVVLHCKEVPWFVSDTMPKDFDLLVAQLQDASFFSEIYESAEDKHSIGFFVKKLQSYVASGQISTQHHPFWTSCVNFWDIPHQHDLYEELQKSGLVIFKGDLNYRKLTGDLEWDPTTLFKEALQGLAGLNIPVLALRTCKADVVVGLPEGIYEKLVKVYKEMGNETGEFWTSSGKWAVISFNY